MNQHGSEKGVRTEVDDGETRSVRIGAVPGGRLWQLQDHLHIDRARAVQQTDQLQFPTRQD